MRKIVAFVIVSFLMISTLGALAFSYDNRDNINFSNAHISEDIYETNSHMLSIIKKSDTGIPPPAPVKKLRVLPRMFDAYIYTKCSGVEKRTSIIYGLLSPIDVDDNSNTGDNGKDVKVRFYIIPYISRANFGWVLSFSIVMEVERLGEEIKDEDFEIYTDVHLSLESYDYGNHEFRIGYSSAEGREVPKSEEVVLTIYPYLMYDRNPDFVLESTPSFEGGESDMDLIARYSGNFGGDTFDHNVVISCQPAISSTIKFTPDFDMHKINTSISRTANRDTTLTLSYDGNTNGDKMGVALTVERVPKEMSFSVFYSIFGASGDRGLINYGGSSEFNVTLTVRIEKIGLAGTMRLEYLPRQFSAGWANRIYGGHVNVSVSSPLTKFIMCDDIDNPSIYFSISNVTNSANFSWGIDQGGYARLSAEHRGPVADFYWKTGSMKVEMVSQLKTDYFFISWNIDQEGYVSFDTDGNWLNSFSFNFTIDGNVGLLIGASFIKADNFRAEWTIWPPTFQISGSMDFIGDIVFSVMLGGTWYPVF